MGAMKRHFQDILEQHFNYTPYPAALNAPHVHTPANEQHALPRRVFILSRNGEPIDAYTNADTANYEMHLCMQGDDYESAGNPDYPFYDYEVRELRLCYATL